MRSIKLALLFLLLASSAAAQVIPSGPWGSLNYWGVGGASQVLAPGLAGQCLETQGTGSAPIWIACPGSALNLLPAINTNQFYGNVSGNSAPPVGVDVNTILNTVGYDIARPPAVESILYKSNVGPTFNWQALPPGPTGQILTSGGPTNPPFWSPSPTQSNLASICQTIGALLYFDAPSLLWKCILPGVAGSVLQSNGAGANPTWQPNNALTSTSDTNVTIALGGTPSTALLQPVSVTMGWTGTLAAGRLNSNVVQSITNDTNVTGAVSAQNLTLGWTGTLAAGRLNANVVQSVSNDTNVTGAISAQNLTLGWTGTLAIARGGTGAGTQQAALNAIMCTPTRPGDIAYWNGTNWVCLAGNNSGTGTLQETSLGALMWSSLSSGAAGQLPGTATNDNATAGNVGEYITSTVTHASPVSFTSATITNLTSVSLTAGDWDCSGNIGTDVQNNLRDFRAWFSTTSVTDPGPPNAGGYAQGCDISGPQFCNGFTSLSIPRMRFSLASTTTVFFSGIQTATGGANTMYGFIGCRRAR